MLVRLAVSEELRQTDTQTELRFTQGAAEVTPFLLFEFYSFCLIFYLF